MAKQTINEIDEQIKKLMNKKKELLEKRSNSVGSYLISSWGLDDSLTEEDIYKIIDSQKPLSQIG